MNDNTSKGSAALAFAAVAAVGTLVVPKLSKKAGDKAYKAENKRRVSEIDFDDMGPEIVRKDGKDIKYEGDLD